MKKILYLAVAALMFMGCSEDRDHILKVYNWADYIDEDLIDEFEVWYEEQTGEPVEIIYQTFDINETMLSKIELGHEDYDVVCPSDYIIERMLKNDLLLPLERDFGTTPDYIGNVAPFIKEKFEEIEGHGKDANDYSVAYMWGTVGLPWPFPGLCFPLGPLSLPLASSSRSGGSASSSFHLCFLWSRSFPLAASLPAGSPCLPSTPTFPQGQPSPT